MSYAGGNNTSFAYRPYEDVYGDSAQYGAQYDRPSRPQYNRRGSSVPRDHESDVRRRQMEEYYRPGQPRTHLRSNRSGRHDRDSEYYGQDRRRRGSYSSRSSQSGDEEDDRDDEQRGGQSEGGFRRTDYFRRNRARSETRSNNGQQQQQTKPPRYNGDLLHYKSDDGFTSYFDKSGNGLLAAVAGAGIGAITARTFDRNAYDPKKSNSTTQKLKLAGGAVVGGLLANAAEEKYRQWATKNGAPGADGKI